MKKGNTLKLTTQGKSSLFARIDNHLKLEAIFKDGLPVRYLPYILYTTLLVVIYIGYNHYAEKTTREIGKLENQVEDLRADYTTLKSDYMFSRLQSEVAKRAKSLGLEDNSEPPEKIIVKKGEY